MSCMLADLLVRMSVYALVHLLVRMNSCLWSKVLKVNSCSWRVVGILHLPQDQYVNLHHMHNRYCELYGPYS